MKYTKDQVAKSILRNHRDPEVVQQHIDSINRTQARTDITQEEKDAIMEFSEGVICDNEIEDDSLDVKPGDFTAYFNREMLLWKSNIMNNQLIILEKKVSPVVAQATALEITSSETLNEASILRENIKKLQKSIEEDKEPLYRKAKDVVDEINSRYDKFLKPLKEALKISNDKMSAFQTQAIKTAQEEAEKIADRIKPGKGNLSLEKGLEKMAGIEAPAVLDMTGFTNRPVLKIVNIKDIPLEFWIPNETFILATLKEGKQVPGCVLEDNYQPRSNR